MAMDIVLSLWDHLSAALLGGPDLSAASGVGGFLREFITDVNKLSARHDYLGIMIDWRVLVVIALFVAFGLYTRSKFVLLTIFALYGVTITHRFAIGPAGPTGQMTQDVGGIAIFVVGFLAVVATIIYFGFVRGD